MAEVIPQNSAEDGPMHRFPDGSVIDARTVSWVSQPHRELRADRGDFINCGPHFYYRQAMSPTSPSVMCVSDEAMLAAHAAFTEAVMKWSGK